MALLDSLVVSQKPLCRSHLDNLDNLDSYSEDFIQTQAYRHSTRTRHAPTVARVSRLSSCG
jgi:hypothetical protein